VARYLTVREVLKIHEDQLTRHGGAAGVRTRDNLSPRYFVRKPVIMPI